jgi:hypothetical protein
MGVPQGDGNVALTTCLKHANSGSIVHVTGSRGGCPADTFAFDPRKNETGRP